MSIVYLGSAEISSLATSGGTMAWPSSITSGDYGEVLITSRGHDSGITYPTVVDTDSGGNLFTRKSSTANRKGHLFYKRATSATAGKIITISGCSNSAAAGLDTFSGVTQSGDPINDLTSEQNEGVDPKIHSGITPSYMSSFVRFAVFNNTNDIAVTSLACDNPGSLEPEFFEALSTGGSDCAVISSGREQAGGPTHTGNFTWTQGANQNYSMAWTLRPHISSSATTIAPPSSTSQNPIHVFGAAGTYTVTLTTTDALGRSGSTSGSVVVA